jgi:hypothetical protein
MKLGEPKFLSIRYKLSKDIRLKLNDLINKSKVGDNIEIDSTWNIIWDLIRHPVASTMIEYSISKI